MEFQLTYLDPNELRFTLYVQETSLYEVGLAVGMDALVISSCHKCTHSAFRHGTSVIE